MVEWPSPSKSAQSMATTITWRSPAQHNEKIADQILDSLHLHSCVGSLYVVVAACRSQLDPVKNDGYQKDYSSRNIRCMSFNTYMPTLSNAWQGIMQLTTAASITCSDLQFISSHDRRRRSLSPRFSDRLFRRTARHSFKADILNR